MKHIPNIITSMNLVSGFIGIIFASSGDLITASWLIALAMVFDFFDGFSARALKAYSDMGKELDSLADAVSFGVAPAMIVFHLISGAVSPDALMLVNENPLRSVIMFLPVLMPVCAALRLAKFNIDTTQTITFRGLPTPANAIGVITVIFAVNYSESSLIREFAASPAWLVVYTIILSLLMVSRIPLLSLKIKSFSLKGNEGLYFLAASIVLIYIFLGLIVLPLIVPLYIAASALQFGMLKTGTSS